MPKTQVRVVDDNDTELDVLRLVLEDAGLEVATLRSVFDLPVAIHRDRPHVIVLDVRMPALRGDRAAAVLQQHGFPRDIPVILHSGIEEGELAKIAAATVVSDQVFTSGDFELLIEKIRRAVGG